MGRSKINFERWVSREKSTWPFQVFQKYNLDFERLFWAHVSASKFVYTTLGKNSADWRDQASEHFSFDETKKKELYGDLKDWSDSFNQFDNWTNLNSITTLSSNLETYMASVITLALESDPGVLFGTSRLVDGVSILKHGTTNLNLEDHITSCTKGVWSSRASGYKKIFGTVPDIIIRNLSQLEAIRNLRNKVSHAFGRDIEQARKHGVLEILPIESLSRDRTLRYQRLIWSVAKSIDVHLLSTHIGEYQSIRFYHSLYPKLRMDTHPSERAMVFKKEIGRFKAALAGKLFSKELVAYYESL